MRKLSRLLVAGAGLAAIAGVAVAAERDAHVLNVVLPDGSVERIHYVGNVAPHVVLAPAVTPVALLDGGDPFALFDRIAAEMDARTDAMLRQVAAMQAQAPALAGAAPFDHAVLAGMPAGTVSYSVTSFSSGNGTCRQSMQVMSYAPGQAPKVVRQSAVDCSAMTQTRAVPAVAPVAPASAAAPKVTRVSYDAPNTPPRPRETI